MLLVIFRHGPAEEKSPGESDDVRALTREGARKVRQAGKGLRRLIRRPELILTSPKRRAVQTAEILGKIFRRKPQEMAELASQDAEGILRGLGEYRADPMLIVGHEPVLSELIGLLCFGVQREGAVELKKAGCAGVEVERTGPSARGQGRLLWLMTAKELRRLGS